MKKRKKRNKKRQSNRLVLTRFPWFLLRYIINTKPNIEQGKVDFQAIELKLFVFIVCMKALNQRGRNAPQFTSAQPRSKAMSNTICFACLAKKKSGEIWIRREAIFVYKLVAIILLLEFDVILSWAQCFAVLTDSARISKLTRKDLPSPVRQLTNSTKFEF